MSAPLFFKPRLMTPGPTDVPPAVLMEMAQPIIHHRTKEFQAIFAEMNQSLKSLYRTTSPVLTLAGSGTTAVEAAMISLIKPGSKALCIATGKFGERWDDIYAAYGIDRVSIALPWGQAPDPAEIEKALKANPDISVVTLVHSETSTATISDLKAIAAIVSKTDAILICDGITSVGAMPVEQDAWNVDCLVTGSQKALMLPPGLGFVGLGPRALERLKQTKGLPSYNLDLRKWLKSYEKNDVPFTPPVSLIRGQNVALKLIEQQGLENIWTRTAKLAAASRAAFSAMGLKLASTQPSDSVTGAFYPDGIEDSPFRKSLVAKYGINIAGGQDGRGGKWTGKVFRINHMGWVDAGDTLATLIAIESELRSLGTKIQPGAALNAAGKELQA